MMTNKKDKVTVALTATNEMVQADAKTLGNTTAKKLTANVSDIEFWGNGDTFRLICKASSKKEGWMKSTKALDIQGVGCIVQVTTQQGDNVAEALTFVPRVKIQETEEGGVVVARRLERF